MRWKQIRLRNKKIRSSLGYLNVALSFGVGMAIRLFLGYYGGQWLDNRLGTEPWITLALILLAIGLSFHHLITEYLKIEKKSEETERDEKTDDPDQKN